MHEDQQSSAAAGAVPSSSAFGNPLQSKTMDDRHSNSKN